MSFTFLHAADIHLDSPLLGLSRYEGAPVDAIRLATRKAFERMIELAILRKVDFVIISGDLYDGDWKDHNTGLYFTRQAQRLNDAGIPLFLIAGNHDAQAQMTRSLRLPELTRMLSAHEPETVELADLGVAIHGQSFATRAVFEDLSQRYPQRRSGLYNIGLLHTSFTGREGHDSYAPCTLNGLQSREYQYWALGHVHQREELWSQDSWIGFPGNLQGRHIRETGPKGCLLVTVNNNQETRTEFLPLDVFRWNSRTIDVSSLATDAELWSAVEDELRAIDEDGAQLPQAVRLTLKGATPLFDRLVTQRPRMISEFQNSAIQVTQERVWLEKVVFQIQPLPRHMVDAADSQLPLGEMMSYLEELRARPSLLQELGKDIEELTKKLPADFDYDATDLNLRDELTWQRLLTEVEAVVLSKLTAQQGTSN